MVTDKYSLYACACVTRSEANIKCARAKERQTLCAYMQNKMLANISHAQNSAGARKEEEIYKNNRYAAHTRIRNSSSNQQTQVVGFSSVVGAARRHGWHGIHNRAVEHIQ